MEFFLQLCSCGASKQTPNTAILWSISMHEIVSTVRKEVVWDWYSLELRFLRALLAIVDAVPGTIGCPWAARRMGSAPTCSFQIINTFSRGGLTLFFLSPWLVLPVHLSSFHNCDSLSILYCSFKKVDARLLQSAMFWLSVHLRVTKIQHVCFQREKQSFLLINYAKNHPIGYLFGKRGHSVAL